MSTRRRAWWLVGLGLLAMVAAACGSGDGPELVSDAVTTPTTPVEPDPTTTRPQTEDEPALTTATSIVDTSTPDFDDCTGLLPTGSIPVEDYHELQLCGWPVFMHDDLYQDELAVVVYDMLAADLQTVISAVPDDAVTFLRETNLWLELDVPAFPGGVYHPSAEWLGANGYPVEWAGGIQIGNAQNYLTWTEQQPAMVLHELTHALHHQRYGFDDPDVLAAFDRAMGAGLYDSVEYVTGGLQIAYATTDPGEYLAELTEAYFWTNDYFPFHRAELAAHDPEGLALVEQIWQVG